MSKNKMDKEITDDSANNEGDLKSTLSESQTVSYVARKNFQRRGRNGHNSHKNSKPHMWNSGTRPPPTLTYRIAQ